MREPPVDRICAMRYLQPPQSRCEGPDGVDSQGGDEREVADLQFGQVREGTSKS